MLVLAPLPTDIEVSDSRMPLCFQKSKDEILPALLLASGVRAYGEYLIPRSRLALRRS